MRISIPIGLGITLLGVTALAAGAGESGGGGIGQAGFHIARVTLAPLAPVEKYTGAAYGTGGVGLRNRAGGNIAISGVEPPIRAAFLYWAVITNGAPKAADASVMLQRVLPTVSKATSIAGTVIGTGASPCWGGDRISVYRGTVPTSVATGNGDYLVSLQKGAAGLTAGEDPWADIVLPLVDGASLALIGKGTSTVAIYDKGLAGATFAANPGITYSLKFPVAAPAKVTLFDSIGADGQHGASRTAIAGESSETTSVNGNPIAGPGSAYIDSDWNGSSGLPLPQLWDDVGHDITSVVAKNSTSLSVTVDNGGASAYDCLTPVANILALE
jgi:hypothetical protein